MAFKLFAAGKVVEVSILSVLIVSACVIRLVFGDWINVRGKSTIDTGPALCAGVTGVLWIFSRNRCHPLYLSRGREGRAVCRISLLRENEFLL